MKCIERSTLPHTNAGSECLTMVICVRVLFMVVGALSFESFVSSIIDYIFYVAIFDSVRRGACKIQKMAGAFKAPPPLQSWTNWGENVMIYGCTITPKSIDDVIEAVLKYERLIVVASGHSFVYPCNHTANDTSENCSFGIISLVQNMNKIISVDKEKLIVEVEGGITLAELASSLAKEGLALENSPSLLQVTAAGCFATGTHGTGVKNHALTDLCESLTIVCGDGVVRKVYPRSQHDTLYVFLVSILYLQVSCMYDRN